MGETAGRGTEKSKGERVRGSRLCGPDTLLPWGHRTELVPPLGRGYSGLSCGLLHLHPPSPLLTEPGVPVSLSHPRLPPFLPLSILRMLP